LSNEGQRDRDIENLLGQFLVASFQTDKLGELIYERMGFRHSSKEISFLIPAREKTRPPMMVTVKIEPYNRVQSVKPEEEGDRESGEESSKEAVKVMCILESPELEVEGEKAKNDVEEVIGGSFQWQSTQGHHYGYHYGHLRLQDWKISTFALNKEDSGQTETAYRTLMALDEKRKGGVLRP